jgi:flagellar biosynthetic protein FlhB
MSQSAGEKTEIATAKKRRDARQRGQVLKSTEVNTAFCSAIMFALLLIIWPSMTDKLAALYKAYLSPATMASAREELNATVFTGVFLRAITDMGRILLPILATAVLAGVAINLLQVGFLFTTKTLEPKLDRISPIKGFGRMFSMRTLTELVKSLLKIVVLGYVVYGDYKKLVAEVPNYTGRDIHMSFLNIMNTAFTIALKMSLVIAVIAAGDYLFQWWKHEKDLKMTKQEVKDEYKLSEGDPQIKSRIRQKQRQLSAMRTMERVPTADVVITNPTHFAVALKYEEGRDEAPIVVAKGQDFLARKIKEVAREHNIELVENKTLARALYESCEMDDPIPLEFYHVVADILVAVYRRKNRVKR